ncbi:hypothetical protein GCM10009544_51240 [Streptomyces stramineus]|uniref:Uncharacterized protein n=1 Tax=Streptomyces stramineus TaxID=173861 RepID=A0ABP3KPT5_9ACTN
MPPREPMVSGMRLTRERIGPEEVVPPQADGCPGPLPRRGAEYALPRDRVALRLGPVPQAGARSAGAAAVGA